jgi:hypothetical protein
MINRIVRSDSIIYYENELLGRKQKNLPGHIHFDGEEKYLYNYRHHQGRSIIQRDGSVGYNLFDTNYLWFDTNYLWFYRMEEPLGKYNLTELIKKYLSDYIPNCIN